MEYDGTNYCGFQIQPNGLTVQEVVEGVLKEVLGHPVRVMAASRTDAGVHACGQVIAFDTSSTIPAVRLPLAMNNRLPPDIRILTGEEVSSSFHPRYDARIKKYRYVIYRRRQGSAFWFNRAWLLYIPLDVDRMKEAASYLVGTHDLTSFCAAGSEVKDRVRTIMSCDLADKGDRLELDIAGDGFLYHTVRIVVGTLVEIGRGYWSPQYMDYLLKVKDRKKAGPTAPAAGLYLMEVVY